MLEKANFAWKLRYLRKATKELGQLTQNQFAELLDWSFYTVQNIERERKEFEPHMAFELAEKLKEKKGLRFNIDWLSDLDNITKPFFSKDSDEPSTDEIQDVVSKTKDRRPSAICSNSRCPENGYYLDEFPDGIKYCLICGSTLLKSCPECGATIVLPIQNFCGTCKTALRERKATN